MQGWLCAIKLFYFLRCFVLFLGVSEAGAMVERGRGVWLGVQSVRQQLYDELTKLNSDRDWSFVLRQIGMFSFTGLTPAQVPTLTPLHASPS